MSDTRTRIEVLGLGAMQQITEHRDGRVDVAVQPAPMNWEAILHRTGHKRGRVAEVREKRTRREINPRTIEMLHGGEDNLHRLARAARASRHSGVPLLGRSVEELLREPRSMAGAAITASGYYGLTLEKQLIDTAALSMESEVAVKVLMVEDGYTPNYDTHDFRNDITNEVAGTGYTAGGSTLTTTELTLSGGTMTYDGADITWSTSTIPNAMAAVGYFNVGTSATDMLLWLSDFVTAASSTAGNFTIQWHASGIITIDYTP